MKFPRPVDSDVSNVGTFDFLFLQVSGMIRTRKLYQTKRVYGLRRVPSAVLHPSLLKSPTDPPESAGIRSQDCSHIVLASNIAESSLTLPLEFRTCRDRADIGMGWDGGRLGGLL